jgi:inorganic triphosphatase YgiF
VGREVELKLEVPVSAIGDALRLPWLSECSAGSPKFEKLVTVYFDTAKFRLRDHSLALRIRHVGKHRLQTIKTDRKGARGAFGRDEWEAEIDSDTPNLKLAKGTVLEPLATKKLQRKLKPIFETVVERTTFPIHVGDVDFELAVDHGFIEAQGRREPISEIEIESKSGDSGGISAIAERLAESIPVTYAAQSKAERGYTLSDDQAHKPVCAAGIELDPEASTADAFQTIALSCLDHATANARAVRGGDTEGIHQMRVGLRQLRAAMSVFKELLSGRETKEIKIELKWLTEELGPARDFDVLIEGQVRPMRRSGSITAELGVLEDDLEAKRSAGLEKAKSALDSERYRELGLRTALWLSNGEWLNVRDPLSVGRRERAATDFAAEHMAKRTKKIWKKLEDIEALDAQQRHKLRIAVKKLRYASEFFAGLFDSGKQAVQRKRFGKILKDLQGSLGTLNDIEVHKRLAVTIGHPRKRPRKQPKEPWRWDLSPAKSIHRSPPASPRPEKPASNCPIYESSGIRQHLYRLAATWLRLDKNTSRTYAAQILPKNCATGTSFMPDIDADPLCHLFSPAFPSLKSGISMTSC